MSLFSDLSIQRNPLCSCEGPVVFVKETEEQSEAGMQTGMHVSIRAGLTATKC